MTNSQSVKRRFISRAMALALAIAISLVACAATSFTVQAPRQVAAGNKFNVTFVLRNAEGSNFQTPEVSGAVKIYGPGKSTSYSSSWVNGKTSSSSSEEYTMLYRADEPGRVHIGAATIMVDGKPMRTNPVTVEVVAGQPSGGRQRDRDERAAERDRDRQRSGGQVQYDDPMTQSADKAVTAGDLFVRIEMSKPRVYEQQAVVCTIKLYTKYQVTQFLATQQPSFDGFLIEEIPQQPSLNNVETVGGQQYMVAVLKKCLLYPQQSGKLTITSGSYDVSVVQYEQYRTIFGTLSQPVEKSLKVQSNTATVNILPLPEPRPASFTGAVGRFTITDTITPGTLKTYAAATYRCVVAGTGNIKYVKAPEPQFPKQMDVYDPKTSAQAKTTGTDMAGTMTAEYPFIPQFAGTFGLPEREFSYFDPEAERYQTVVLPARQLVIDKGEGAPSSHYTVRNMDIRPIATGDLALDRERTYLVGSARYWLWYVIPALLLVVVMAYYRKLLRERADVGRMRTKRASRVAQRRLKLARQFIATADRNAFYAETLSSLWGYLSDKLAIPVSELSKDSIVAELEEYGVDEQLRSDTLSLLDKCEFAQYAPELAGQDLQQVWNDAAALIDRLESTKRTTTPS